jgi:hypothetical protein
MDNKNIAFYDYNTFLEFKFLSKDYCLKVLNEQEKEKLFFSKSNPFDDDTYSPFNQMPYWLEITKIDLTKKEIREDWISFNKLIKINQFKDFSIDSSVVEFENNFFEGSYDIKDNLIIRHPKIEPFLKYSKNEEAYKNFISRCKNKYKSNSVYVLTFQIASDLLIDFEYFKYEKQIWLNDSPIVFERKWEKSEFVKNSKYLVPLKEIIIEICQKLEKNNINNYFIRPDTTGEETQKELDRQDSLSWGNYDPYGLG